MTSLIVRSAFAAAALFAFAPSGNAVPLAANSHVVTDGTGVLRGVILAHGVNVIGPHCFNAWSTSTGWHLHPRDCYLPQYNPRWRDPNHWHWRLYEEARQRRYLRRHGYEPDHWYHYDPRHDTRYYQYYQYK